MLYDVSVCRTSTATRNIRVDAASAEEAEAKALEIAGDTDFTGCVVEYDFDVAGSTPVDGDGKDDEPEPDLASEEKRCPDLSDGTCALCPAAFPGVSDETIDAGWLPSYFIGDEEQSGPVCPNCAAQFIVWKDEGELNVNGEYVSVWDGGVEVKSPCTVDPRSRKIEIEYAADVGGLETMEREYVVLNGTEYEAANEEYRYEFTPEQQARMFFWA